MQRITHIRKEITFFKAKFLIQQTVLVNTKIEKPSGPVLSSKKLKVLKSLCNDYRLKETNFTFFLSLDHKIWVRYWSQSLLSLINFGMSTFTELGTNKEVTRINEPFRIQFELLVWVKPTCRSHFSQTAHTKSKFFDCFLLAGTKP